MGIGNIGWTEFVVILAIALIFFGPRRLPEIARALGKSLREFRKALNEVRTEINIAEKLSDPPASQPSKVTEPSTTPTVSPQTEPSGTVSESERSPTAAQDAEGSNTGEGDSEYGDGRSPNQS